VIGTTDVGQAHHSQEDATIEDFQLRSVATLIDTETPSLVENGASSIGFVVNTDERDGDRNESEILHTDSVKSVGS